MLKIVNSLNLLHLIYMMPILFKHTVLGKPSNILQKLNANFKEALIFAPMEFFRKLIFSTDCGNFNKNILNMTQMLTNNFHVLKIGFEIGFEAVIFTNEIIFFVCSSIFNNFKI